MIGQVVSNFNVVWIPVKERLPLKDVVVLCYSPELKNPFYIGYFYDEPVMRKVYTGFVDVHGTGSIQGVTHWAQLPDIR